MKEASNAVVTAARFHICDLLREEIEAGSSVRRIWAVTNPVNDHDHIGFFYFYAGVLLARRGRFPCASKFFREAENKGPGSALAFEFAQRPTLVGEQPLFQDARPFEIWNGTEFAQRDVRAKIESFVRFYTTLSARSDTPTIVDIGTGDGVLIARFINALHERKYLKGVRLVLLDISQAMLNASIRNCAERLHCPHELLHLQADISLVKPRELWSATGQPLLAVASECLHHLPRSEKMAALSTLSKAVSNCFLAELEGDHDTPASDSPQLIYSVWRFYGSLVEELKSQGFGLEDERRCLDGLLLSEARQILASSRARRLNYHCPSVEWIQVADDAEYAVKQSEVLNLKEERPSLFLAHLTKDI